MHACDHDAHAFQTLGLALHERDAANLLQIKKSMCAFIGLPEQWKSGWQPWSCRCCQHARECAWVGQMLDILEDYLHERQHGFQRIDGNVGTLCGNHRYSLPAQALHKLVLFTRCGCAQTAQSARRASMPSTLRRLSTACSCCPHAPAVWASTWPARTLWSSLTPTGTRMCAAGWHGCLFELACPGSAPGTVQLGCRVRKARVRMCPAASRALSS